MTKSKIPFAPIAAFAVGALAMVVILALYNNITDRKIEARENVFRIVNITEDTTDPAEWGKNYPQQYDGYKRTVDVERTTYGGSEAFQKLETDPHLTTMFSGMPFGTDYREERGHAYMLSDQDITDRTTKFNQPGACLHCHANVIPAYRDKGVTVGGVPKDEAHRWEAVMKGFDEINKMPLKDARQLVTGPIGCGDCHEPNSMALRVTRPGFINGIRALAESKDPVPHLPSIERWRTGDRKAAYDPNKDASRQEMRSFVCGQCHVEYYFAPPNKTVTFPWKNGLKVEQVEKYYTEVNFTDWTHKDSGAKMLKAQHPEFELWSQGTHARSGVSCADCHMPYKREGAVKVSDHHVRSPMLNVQAACGTCHNYSETELKARVTVIQERTIKLMNQAEDAVVQLVKDIEAAKKAGATDEQLAKARDLHRQAQWRADFIAAENSNGFHAPQESARILAEAIDLARQGQLELIKATKK